VNDHYYFFISLTPVAGILLASVQKLRGTFSSGQILHDDAS